MTIARQSSGALAERELIVLRSLERQDERASHVLDRQDEKRLTRIRKDKSASRVVARHLLDLINQQIDGVDVSDDFQLRAIRSHPLEAGGDLNFLIGVIEAYEYWLDKPLKDELARRERFRKQVLG